MSHLSNLENWSLIALAGSLVLNLVIGLAPGHQHVFGDWTDPVSALTGLLLVSTALIEVAVLFSMSRRTR
jgi:hypothetical protein